MSLQIHQFLCLSDNLCVLLHDTATGATAAIDAPDATPIVAALERKGWALSDILLTHHHADHIQGVPGLKAAFPDVRVSGPALEADKIGELDRELGDGDKVMIGTHEAKVLAVPGHTRGHIAYWFAPDRLLFAGDTLFAMGCGRAFETPPSVLYHSLMKLAALPGETQVYCGHEYTLANARFALSVEPENETLRRRAEAVAALRAEGQFTLPTQIDLEQATNPFLRVEEPEIQKSLGLQNAPAAEAFAALREAKNRA
ncbi:MAG: hydroxyacylglutathione hydrolase [Pseudomonadota bacterium]